MGAIRKLGALKNRTKFLNFQVKVFQLEDNHHFLSARTKYEYIYPDHDISGMEEI